ncbi:fer-1-like protein 4 [Protopterus annectens]|uniref:fer-1-like protein 4 n=1 Tax=Protopterus annectens TaxID=7888 RepID=UPI001CFB91B2|nr:fer-1-like protein 4 [Protopterus annectens]
MSLSVNLKKVSNLPGKYERRVELTFRGFTHKTKKVHAVHEIVFNELFTWPHYGKLIREEMLSIKVYNCTKVFSPRLLGKLVISLQHLMTTGRLVLTEALVDKNNTLTEVFVELEIRYQPPDGSTGTWVEDDFLNEMDDRSPLLDRNDGMFLYDIEGMRRADELDKEARLLGQRLVKGIGHDGEEDDDEDFDVSDIDFPNINFTPIKSRCRFLSKNDLIAIPRPQHFQIRVKIAEAQKLVGVNIDPCVYVKVGEEKKHSSTQKSTNCPFFNEDFMFEFNEPQEILFDKIIQISVVHVGKIPFTNTLIGMFKIDTGTVYSQPDHMFFQKWAVLTDPKDTRGGIKGYVKATISVVGKGDTIGPPSTSSNSQNEDIERNLLLPKQVPAERPWARFTVKIYKGEGLPTMSSGIMGSFAKIIGDKKIFIDPYIQVSFAGQQGETSVESNTISPLWNEQITFVEMFPPLAGRIKLQVLDDANIGDVALATHFIELQQISDSSRVAGFNPTFGPSWINLYGSAQNSVLRDGNRNLNEGLGEGIFYRGRILISVTIDVYSSMSAANKLAATGASKKTDVLSRLTVKRKSKKSKEKEKGKGKGQAQAKGEEPDPMESMDQPTAMTVEVEETHPLPENYLGVKEEFLLFGAFFEASLIDPSIGSKPVMFEVSIGNYGKMEEVLIKSSKKATRVVESEEQQLLLDTGSEDELETEDMSTVISTSKTKSLTLPRKPEPTEYERSYSCITMLYEKPCVYVPGYWEDHTWRLFNSNWLVKICDRLELGLNDVEKQMRRPKSKPEEKLKCIIEEFIAGCRQYLINAEKKTMPRPNNLDRCRMKFLKHSVLLQTKRAIKAWRRLNRHTVKDKLNDLKKILKRLRFLAKEPQCTLPDVFIWMLCNNKRIAYARLPSQNILYSVVEEEKGKDCGKIQTVYLKAPGSSVGEIFAKLEMYLWLGVVRYAKNSISSLPEEFRPIYEEATRTVDIPAGLPPCKLESQDMSYFQLRAHMYQARGVLPADDNGLSDPFARVVFATQCLHTRILEETLSPTWTETLLMDQIVIEASKLDLQNDPPVIIINIFDYDKIGAPEFIGRSFAFPSVKLLNDPYVKPSLQFFDIYRGRMSAGELIAAFELLELDYSGYLEPLLPDDVEPKQLEHVKDEETLQSYYIIPEGIRPVLKEFRIEVLFWGLRDLKRVSLFEVEQPQVVIECAGQKVESEVIPNYKENPNFDVIVKFFIVNLPELVYLHPPLSIYVKERRAFGRTVLVGSHIVTNIMKFSKEEMDNDKDEPEPTSEPKRNTDGPSSSHTVVNMEAIESAPASKKTALNHLMDPLKKVNAKKLLIMTNELEEYEEEKPEKEELDWWSKYYASLEEIEDQAKPEDEDEDEPQETDVGHINQALDLEGDADPNLSQEVVQVNKKNSLATLKIYRSELEKQFDEFEDWLYTFPLYRGKAIDDEDGDDDNRYMGKYKGSFHVYLASEATDDYRILQSIPRNRPLKVLVRVYVIKATNLTPADPNGKADPYIVVKIGEQHQDSKDRYIPKQLNPVFGEVFEMTISFPLETELMISIYDHDMVGSDDLIGETKIDLENRYYSAHRANCGIAKEYDIDGYNAWRDAFKPTQILANLCKKHDIPLPEYRRDEVKVKNTVFKIPNEVFQEENVKKKRDQEEDDTNKSSYDEQKALYVLQHWKDMPEHGCILVPEHVEERSLFIQDNPGLSQGSVHMWIDMFPNDVPAPAPVNIKPRLPISYELRLTIWNTDDVILDDVNPITGERSSDIYVKGWIKGLDDEKQETDVHFNSLTGEGNFNWRFIFRFDYLPTEKEITFKKKDSFFSLEESEFRQPAVLILQVWDYDRISANDFLGTIELKLNNMIRGAKSSPQCTIKMAKEKAGPRFSIFRSKRIRGWWPFIKLKSEEDEEREENEAKEKKKKKKKKKKSSMKHEDVEFTDSGGNVFILAGKVEAEFQLLTVEEAEKSPVGLGRKEPEPLEKPNRPTTSFNWFMNPMKTCVFFIWKRYKKFIIAFLILVILALFLSLIIYTMPGYISQKIISG